MGSERCAVGKPIEGAAEAIGQICELKVLGSANELAGLGIRRLRSDRASNYCRVLWWSNELLVQLHAVPREKREKLVISSRYRT